MDFAILVDHKVKTKESEKRDKYLDIARELRKLWNMKVAVIPIVIGAVGIIPKGLERSWKIWKLDNKLRPSKLQHCWDHWEESWRPEETYCLSNSIKRPSVNADGKNSPGV